MSDSTKRLEVRVRHAYGQERIYPVNQTALLVAKLLGTRTISTRDLGILQELGYEVAYLPTVPKGAEGDL